MDGTHQADIEQWCNTYAYCLFSPTAAVSSFPVKTLHVTLTFFGVGQSVTSTMSERIYTGCSRHVSIARPLKIRVFSSTACDFLDSTWCQWALIHITWWIGADLWTNPGWHKKGCDRIWLDLTLGRCMWQEAPLVNKLQSPMRQQETTSTAGAHGCRGKFASLGRYGGVAITEQKKFDHSLTLFADVMFQIDMKPWLEPQENWMCHEREK